MSDGTYRSVAARRTVAQRYRESLQRWTIPVRDRTVATREGDTFVLECGPADAPPVVLLHGAGSNSAIWQTDAVRWSATHRLYLVDIIGEPGFSAPSRPGLASDAHALWLDDVLDALELAYAALVGVSLGGWLAVDYAIRRPARVERLGLRAPGGIGRQRYGALLAASALMPFGERGMRRALQVALGPGEIPDPVADYLAVVQRSYRPRRDTLPVFSDDALGSITAPILVVAGERDRLLDTHDTAARVTRLLPQATVDVRAGAGHGLLDDGVGLHAFLGRVAAP